MNYSIIIGYLWFIFIFYWLISAIGVKKDVYRAGGKYFWLWRLVAVLILVWVLRSQSAANFYTSTQNLINLPVIFKQLGLVLCAAGVALAIWARVYLGRNWSPSPALKENHELITSGPYSSVRHPIYSGMLLAILGAVLVDGIIPLIIFVLVFVMFAFRVKREDGLMAQQFPNQFPSYKQKTYAVIPYIW